MGYPGGSRAIGVSNNIFSVVRLELPGLGMMRRQ